MANGVTLSDLAHGIGDRIRTLPGATVYDEPVTGFDYGAGGFAAIIAPRPGTGIAQVTYDYTASGVVGNVDTTIWAIRILAPDSDDVGSSDLLYSIMSRGTVNSVYDAINGDPTLGGKAQKTLVLEAINFDILQYSDNRSFACVDFILQVEA